MKTTFFIALFSFLPSILFTQITVKQNGKKVKINNTGISVSSDDVITVSIPNDKAKETCMKNMRLNVSLTYSEETDAPIIFKNKNKRIIKKEGRKHLLFKWICKNKIHINKRHLDLHL